MSADALDLSNVVISFSARGTKIMDWIAPLISLSAMEIVLGIDNVIFIAILVTKLPSERQARARQIGLGLALVMRLGLLFGISWIMSLQTTLFDLETIGVRPEWITWSDHPEQVLQVTGKDLVLLIGGLFLIAKSVNEIHAKLEGAEHNQNDLKPASFGWVLAQIIMLDIIFSLDSVITAVGMVKPEHFWVMITAMVLAVGVMLIFAGPISNFVHKHPTIKILALAFLILIGVMLVIEGTGGHMNKGYIYFAMAFSLAIELLNIRLRKNLSKVNLHEPPPVKS
jgi:predicted tellurium resistance membrane protein TerC